MKKTEKSFFVENLSEELKSATSLVLVNYTYLTVKQEQALKKRLKEVGAKMFVAKNTLFKISAKNAKLSDDLLTDTVLSGPTAFVISEADPIAPLQVLAKFTKEFEIPQLKVGVVEGKFQDKESLLKLSLLPSKEILYAQVIGGISAPMYGLLGTLRGNTQKLIYILKTKSE